jgi:hypothetical protein
MIVIKRKVLRKMTAMMKTMSHQFRANELEHLTVYRQLNPGLGSSFLYRRQNRAVKNQGARLRLNPSRVEVS